MIACSPITRRGPAVDIQIVDLADIAVDTIGVRSGTTFVMGEGHIVSRCTTRVGTRSIR